MADKDTARLTIDARGLMAGYGKGSRRHVVVSNADIQLRAGDFAVMVGANGAGKSTLLRTLAGIQPRLGGTLLLGGEDPAAMSRVRLARTVAMVFTERGGAGGLSVREFVSLGRQPHTGFFGRLSASDREAVERAMEQCSVASLADKFMARVSDGERQKAMIARALAQDTPVIMLDEPTSFLDVASRIEALEALSSMARETGRTILLSTHDIAAALRAASHVVVVSPESGRADTFAGGSPGLNKALDDIFASRGITFDAATADFRMRHPKP